MVQKTIDHGVQTSGFGVRQVFLLIMAGILTGCDDGDATSPLKGRYVGTLSRLGVASIQVVAQGPDLKTLQSGKSVTLRVYPALPNTPPLEYRLEGRGDEKLALWAPETGQVAIELARKDSCALGQWTESEVRLCWQKDGISLLIANRGSEFLKLELKRSNELPAEPSSDDRGRTYTLNEILGRAKFLNYSVTQDAERVYQAKENIGVARGNLLPSLNVKTVIGIFTGDYLGVVGKLLPFLFPSNWYRWEATKDLHRAERASFASLRGNEINAVEGIYYVVLRDQVVLQTLQSYLGWMRATQENLRKEERAGTLPTGSAEFFGNTLQQLERDRVAMERLVTNSYSEIAHAVALPPISGISGLAPIDVPDLLSEKPIRSQDFVKEALARSYEIKTLGALLDASRNLANEVLFGFLDPDGNGSIGFGTASSIRVSKSRENEIRLKTQETSSLLAQRSAQAATEFNSALEAYRVAATSIATEKKRLNWLIHRHMQGDPTLDEAEFVEMLADAQVKLISFTADQASSVLGWRIAKSRVERLLLIGPYQGMEDALPEEPKSARKPSRNQNQKGNRL